MIEAKQYKTATKIVQLGNAITYYRNVKMHALGPVSYTHLDVYKRQVC